MGSALDAGQIEQVIEDNILTTSADNTCTNAFSKDLWASSVPHALVERQQITRDRGGIE